jgi:hypothetical protein
VDIATTLSASTSSSSTISIASLVVTPSSCTLVVLHDMEKVQRVLSMVPVVSLYHRIEILLLA